MFFRLLIESLRRGSRRKLVALAAIALGLAAATALVEVLVASGDRVAAEMGSYGANLEVVPAEGRTTFDAADLAVVRKIFWRNNVLAVAPLLELRARFRSGPDASAGEVASVVGTWFDAAVEDDWTSGLSAVRPTLEIEGRWPRDGAAEVALGRRLAQRLDVEPGDGLTAELGDRSGRWTVVGRVTSGSSEEEQAFAPLSAVHALTGQAPGAPSPNVASPPGGPVARAEVFALTNPELENVQDPADMTPAEYEAWYCTAYPSAIAHQIDEAMDDATARVRTEITDATAHVLSRLDRVLPALAAVVLVGAAVGVSAATTATVLERRLEAGLLLALGAQTWKVVGFFLSEAVVLGLAGGLLGGLGGLAGGRLLGTWIFDVSVPWVPLLLPVALGVGVAVAVLGAALPVARALRGRPALILKRATA